MTLSLSLSLLNQIFICGVQFREKLLHIEALEDCLLDLLSPQVHGMFKFHFFKIPASLKEETFVKKKIQNSLVLFYGGKLRQFSSQFHIGKFCEQTAFLIEILKIIYFQDNSCNIMFFRIKPI